MLSIKEYTHAKGFNVSSLKGLSGIYLIRDFFNDLAYIGMCNGDFKNRIISHSYGEHGKLAVMDRYINVVIVDPSIFPLHVLEHLFIWYFSPPRNKAQWIFYGENESIIIQKAKEHGLDIQGSVKEFILSFDSILLKREYGEKTLFKRYGNQEQLFSKRIECASQEGCLCLKCLLKFNKL